MVCVEDKRYLEGVNGVITNLSEREEKFYWIRTRQRLQYMGAEVDFIFYGNDRDLLKLRGPNYDAAIVKGKPSEDFDTLLSFCLRLGDYPIKVKLA